MKTFMLALGVLFSLLWLTPMLMIGWTLALIIVPVYHGFLMMADSLEAPTSKNRNKNE